MMKRDGRWRWEEDEGEKKLPQICSRSGCRARPHLTSFRVLVGRRFACWWDDTVPVVEERDTGEDGEGDTEGAGRGPAA